MRSVQDKARMCLGDADAPRKMRNRQPSERERSTRSTVDCDTALEHPTSKNAALRGARLASVAPITAC
jgi:hypothetical protein